jgi:hypothetical protein
MRAIRASLLMGFAVMLLSALPSADQPWSRTGTVVVRTHHNYVAIGVAPQGGGKLERLFVFWPAEPQMAGVKRIEKAHVEFEMGVLRVIQGAKNASVYYVKDVGKPTSNALEFTSYPGKGLSSYYGETASRFGVSGSGKRDQAVCYLDLAVCKDKIFDID